MRDFGGMGCLRRGKWIRAERVVSGMGESVCVSHRSVIDVKADT